MARAEEESKQKGTNLQQHPGRRFIFNTFNRAVVTVWRDLKPINQIAPDFAGFFVVVVAVELKVHPWTCHHRVRNALNELWAAWRVRTPMIALWGFCLPRHDVLFARHIRFDRTGFFFSVWCLCVCVRGLIRVYVAYGCLPEVHTVMIIGRKSQPVGKGRYVLLLTL